MSRIHAVDIFFIECQKLQDITFKQATITGLSVYGIRLIGPRINFDTTTIQNSSFMGIGDTTVIKEADFSGTTLSTVQFCNVTFDNCVNFQKLAGAFGSTLTDATSVPPECLERFKAMGAKVNGEWGDDIAVITRRRTKESLWTKIKRILVSVKNASIESAASSAGASLRGALQPDQEHKQQDQQQ
jgi:hypothetical protein